MHFPLSNHPWARPAAIAAVCAADQSAEAFWALHDGFFENQRQMNTTNVIEKSRGFLADTGIDLDAWATCAGDTFSGAYKAAAARVEESIKTGSQIGVSGTPSFYINGYFFSGNKPLSLFDETIERALENME
jgi:protein-disulfide isomerase